MTLLDRVSGLLTARGIPHALIGAAALAARGIARSTYDIDLLTTDRWAASSAFSRLASVLSISFWANSTGKRARLRVPNRCRAVRR